MSLERLLTLLICISIYPTHLSRFPMRDFIQLRSSPAFLIATKVNRSAIAAFPRESSSSIVDVVVMKYGS